MRRVDCTGAPRDLGLDQGRACRASIRADARAVGWEPDASWLDRWRRGLQEALPGGSGPAAAPKPRFARDLARHFPHLDERLSGLAAGAGLPREALLVLAEEELGDLPVIATGIAPGTGPKDRARVVVRLRTPLPPTGLVARVTRPDGGYPHVAIVRPGLVAALAGINEHGLAGAVEVLDAPGTRGAGDPCVVSGALLLDQCLERLDTVEKALEWCERRPGGGGARLVFADASGAVGALELDGASRQRAKPAELAPAEREPGVWALLDPATRTLELRGPAGAVERLALEDLAG